MRVDEAFNDIAGHLHFGGPKYLDEASLLAKTRPVIYPILG
jgi:hypothetical protein